MNNLSIKRIGLLIKSDLMINGEKTLLLLLLILPFITLFLLNVTLKLTYNDGVQSTFIILFYALFAAVLPFFLYRKLHRNYGIINQLIPASNEERFFAYISQLVLWFLVYLGVFYFSVITYNFIYQEEITNYINSIGLNSINNKRTDIFVTTGGLLLPNIKGILFKHLTTTPLLIATALYFFYAAIKGKGLRTFFILLLFPLALWILNEVSNPILDMINNYGEIVTSTSSGIRLGTQSAFSYIHSVYGVWRSELVYFFNLQSITAVLFYFSSVVLLISSYYAYKEKEIN